MDTTQCKWCTVLFVPQDEEEFCDKKCEEKQQAHNHGLTLWDNIVCAALTWKEANNGASASTRESVEKNLQDACNEWNEHRAKWDKTLYA